MNYLKPIHTKTAECQDCYKCLRQCSVKAIQINDAHARVIDELCIVCGNCVKVCPVEAKTIRNDIEHVKSLLANNEKVLVSLAPSFVTEFPGVKLEALAAAFKKLGFDGLSETANGAQQISANVASLIDQGGNGVYISSACPTVVQMVKKYYPQYADCLTSLLSPALAHCRMLKSEYGSDTAVVFVGPCIAKKSEADSFPALMDAAITFKELSQWLQEADVDVYRQGVDSKDFLLDHAQEGAMYPVDGGMIGGIKQNCRVDETSYMSFSGIENIQSVLSNLNELKSDSPLFFELLACEGGCINGPAISASGSIALRRLDVLKNTSWPDTPVPRQAVLNSHADWQIEAVQRKDYSEQSIKLMLERVGKNTIDDELNCGGCGYDSCREFAKAMIDHRAEPDMCVGYMRQIAHKKVDVLIRTMPSGVVIVDANMNILECNRKFAQLLGEEILDLFDAVSSLEGASLDKVVSFSRIFEQVLAKGTEAVTKELRVDGNVLYLTVFTIEPHQVVGGFLQDITAPSVRKDQVVTKAKEVIQKNLQTVQQIAFLLGENASESEILLNSIVDAFSAQPVLSENEDAGK